MRVPYALALLCLLTTPAHAVDVSHLSDIEADPCFQQVHARELSAHLGAIESQIVGACADARGNPTQAMAILTELVRQPPWLPPAAGRMSATGVLVSAVAELAAVAVLLGAGLGYAARALGLPAPDAGMSVAIVAERVLLAVLLTVLARVPGVTVLAAAGLLTFAVRARFWSGPRSAAAPSPGGRGQTLALLGTDLLGAFPVSIGIAALARGSPVLAVFGVLASAAASLVHPGLARVLVWPGMTAAASAVLEALVGLAALTDQVWGAVPWPVSAGLPAGLAALIVLLGRWSRAQPGLARPLVP